MRSSDIQLDQTDHAKMLIDTHAHLQDERFAEDWQAVLDAAEQAGVKRILLPGTDIADSLQALRLCALDSRLICAAGVHPHEAAKASAEHLETLNDLVDQHKGQALVAIGEIGLDYHYDISPRDTQQQLFRKQAIMAYEKKLPMIIHMREATADLLQILYELDNDHLLSASPGVFHCFSGSVETARQLLDMGFYLGFDGPVTFKNAKKALQVVAACPKDRLVLETDSPYLTPVPYRGKRNEPAYLTYIAAAIAACWQVTPEEVARLTTENATRLFQLEAFDV